MIDWINIKDISNYEMYTDFAVLVNFEGDVFTDVRNYIDIVGDEDVIYFVPLPAILNNHNKGLVQ